MKIIVDTKNYTPYKYDEYFGGGTPENNPYVVGQVVAVKRKTWLEGGNDKEELAVVLGVITPDEVRLDLCGMTPVEDIRPAVVTDFGKSNVSYPDKLYKECQGYKVDYNWETHELTVEEPNF
jgi:hypothetical protein